MSLREMDAAMGMSHESVRYIITKLNLRYMMSKNRPLANLTKHHSASELGLKYCHVCKIAKPFAEMNQNKQSKDGCIGRCKACSAALNAVRYHDESSGFKAVTLQWQRDSPDKVKAYSKRWYDKMKALMELKW